MNAPAGAANQPAQSTTTMVASRLSMVLPIRSVIPVVTTAILLDQGRCSHREDHLIFCPRRLVTLLQELENPSQAMLPPGCSHREDDGPNPEPLSPTVDLLVVADQAKDRTYVKGDVADDPDFHAPDADALDHTERVGVWQPAGRLSDLVIDRDRGPLLLRPSENRKAVLTLGGRGGKAAS